VESQLNLVRNGVGEGNDTRDPLSRVQPTSESPRIDAVGSDPLLHFAQLCHAALDDSVAGAQRRIAAAQRFAGRPFGIASECGIARGRAPAWVRQFLEVYAGAAAR
jgi:hypothetical protein